MGHGASAHVIRCQEEAWAGRGQHLGKAILQVQGYSVIYYLLQCGFQGVLCHRLPLKRSGAVDRELRVLVSGPIPRCNGQHFTRWKNAPFKDMPLQTLSRM
jgi:hypothetical protein